MKDEHYIILINKFGKEKADNIKNALLEADKRKIKHHELEAEKLREMVNRMIPTKDLKDGVYYNGHRWRGKHVAMWDADKKVFLTINFTMRNFFLEELQHFEDVAETRIDGFIPFFEIEKFTL